jgi:hypothetical protein
MVVTVPGDELPNVTPLILQAKYGKDEATCRAAGAKVIESLTVHGRYSVLIDLCKDEGTPPFLAEEARNNILAAAMVACKNSGILSPLQDVAVRQDVPLVIALHAGAALVMRYSEPYDEKALWDILTDKRYHDKACSAAGEAIMNQAEKERKFSTLFNLATSPDVIYEVKKPAGLLLIKLAVEQGNYPVLLSLEGQKSLPVDIRIALEDQVQAAAMTSIELAYAAKDFAILTDVSEDGRLPVSIRGKAMGCLHDSMHPTPQTAVTERPDAQMTAELMLRLGKQAGAVHSSIAPPVSTERPTFREPRARPKR